MKEQIRTKLGKALKRARKANNLSLREAERITGIHAPNICRIERGDRSFSFRTADRLLKGYDLDLVITLTETS